MDAVTRESLAVLNLVTMTHVASSTSIALQSREDAFLPHGPQGFTWRALTVEDVDDVVELENAIAEQDHPSVRVTREQILTSFDLSYYDLERDTIVAVDADGGFAALGRVVLLPGQEETISARVFGGVRPDRRRRGIGGRVLDWQIVTAARALASVPTPASKPRPVPTELKGFVRGDTASGIALLRSRGFDAARHLVEMHRDLEGDLPDVTMPSDLLLVPASRAWSELMRDAHNDAFRDHWGASPIGVERWEATMSLPSTRNDLSTLAIDGEGDDARVVGLVLVEVHPERFDAAGYSSAHISAVAVRREYRGRGLAKALLRTSLAGIRADGLERAVLDVDSANPTGALNLYEDLEFRPAQRSTVFVRAVGCTQPR